MLLGIPSAGLNLRDKSAESFDRIVFFLLLKRSAACVPEHIHRILPVLVSSSLSASC